MSSVDNRIVNMEFNNAQFEAGVSQSIGTLDKLKSSLKLDNVADGLGKITSAAKNIDLSGISTAVDNLQNRFSTLGVAGMAAITNLTNRAVDAGLKFVKSLTVDPIIDGFNELEIKNKAITTIMANVGEHNTIDEVTNALDELNTYADKTIYNFSEMTNNIGRFTAAGVDLKTSVTAIKGMSNLAAFFGADNTQAQRAMYQMSQALATGRIALMDWNSMVQASMGGTALSDLLTQIGDKMGMGASAAIEKYGSFRESLRSGWLTNDVFLKGLSYFSQEVNDGNEAMLRQQYIAEGWSEEMADHLLYLGKTANDAATRVRSYRQMMDTMSEEVGSSWSQTFELILGGYTGTTKFWDDIYQSISPMLSLMGNLRNSALMSWVSIGGQTTLMGALRRFLGTVDENGNAVNGNGMRQEMLTVGNAFQEVMGLTDSVAKYTSSDPSAKLQIGSTHMGQILLRFSLGLVGLAKNLQLSDNGLKNWGDTWKGIASVIDLGVQSFGLVLNVGSQIVGAFAPMREIFLALTAPLGRVMSTFRDWLLQFDIFMKISDLFKMGLTPIHDGLQWVADALTGLFTNFDIATGLRSILDFFTNIGSTIAGFFTGGVEGLDLGQMIMNLFGGIGLGAMQFANLPIFGQLGERLKSGFESAFNYVSYYFRNAKSLGDVISGVEALGKNTFRALTTQFQKNAPQFIKGVQTTLGNGFKAVRNFAQQVGEQTWLHDYMDAQGVASGSIPKTGNMLVDLAVTAHDVAREIKQTFGIPNLNLFSGLVNGAQSAVEKVKSYFEGAKDFQDYFDGAKLLGSDITEMLKAKFAEVQASLPGIWENFQTQFARASEYVREHASDIPQATRTMAQRVGDYMSNLVSRFQGSGIGESFGNIFEGLKEKALSMVQFFMDHRTDMWNAIKNFGQSISEGAKNVLPSIIDWLDDFFSRIIEKFSNAAQNGIFDRIGETLGKGGEAIGKGFQTFGQNIANSFTAMGDFFKNNSGMQVIMDIPFSDIAMVGEMLSMILLINQIKAVLNTLNTTMTGVGKMVNSIADSKWGPLGWGNRISKSISDFIGEYAKIGTSISKGIDKTTKWIGISMFLKALTPVLLEVAGLAGLAMVDKDAVMLAAGVVGALGILFAAIMKFTSNIGTGGEFSVGEISGLTQMMLGLIGIAGAVWIFSSAAKKLGKLNTDEIVHGLVGIGLILAAASTAVGFMSGYRFGMGGKGFEAGVDILLSMVGLAIAAQAISGAIGDLGSMDAGQLGQGFAAISLIFTEVAVLTGLAARISNGQALISTVGTLVGFAVAARIIAAAYESFGDMQWETIGKGFVAMGSALGALGVAIGVMSRISGTGTIKVSGFIGLATGIIAIAGAFKIFESISWDGIDKGLTALLRLAMGLTGLGAIIGYFASVSNGITILTNALLKLGAASALFGIGLSGIAAFVGMLNDLKTAFTGTGIGESFANLVNGIIDGFERIKGKLVTAVVGFWLSFAESIVQYADRFVTLLGDALCIVFDKLAGEVPRIVTSFKGFVESLFGEVSNQFGDMDWEAFGEMFENLVVTPMLTAIVGKLTNVKFSDIAKVAAALILTVGPLVAAVAFLSQVGNNTGIAAMEGIGNLIETVSSIVIFMGVLNHFTNMGVKDMAAGGAALGLAIDAVVGIVGILAYAVGALDMAGDIERGVDAMQKVIDVIQQFNAGFIALSAVMGGIITSGGGLAAFFAPAAGAASIGLAIDAIVGVVGIAQAAVGALDQLTGGGIVDALERGKEAMGKVGEAIGGILGGFVGEYYGAEAEAKATHMPVVAQKLQTAFDSMKPMIDSIEQIGDSGVDRISNFMTAMSTVGGIDPLMADWKAGAFVSFAKQLPELGTDIAGFANNISTANVTNLDAGMDAMTKMVTFAKDLPDAPNWNLGQWFVGRKQTLSEFAEGLKEFYPTMQELIGVFGNEETLDTSGLLEAIEAAKKISELQNSLQGFQGESVVSFFAGHQQNLIDFAQGIGAFQQQLKGAIDKFGSADTLDITGLEKAITVATQINDLAHKLPEEASLKSGLFGGLPKSLSTFANEIGEMARIMGGIDWSFQNMDAKNGFDQGKFATVISTVSQLAEAAGKMPKHSGGTILGLVNWFDDTYSLASLAQNISEHSEDFNKLFSALNDIDVKEGSAEKMTQITGVLNDLATAQGNLDLHNVEVKSGTGENAYSYKDKITTLGEFVSGLTQGDFLTNLQGFITKLQQFTPEGDLSNLKNVTGMLTDLVTAYNDLPPELDDLQPNENGDYAGKFTAMGDQLGDLAIGLASLSTVAYDSHSNQFRQAKLDAITSAVGSVKTLAEAYGIIAGGDVTPGVSASQSWTNFSTTLTDLGKGLQSIAQAVDGVNPEDGSKIENFNIDKIDTAVQKVKDLAGLVGKDGALSGFQNDSFEPFTTALVGKGGLGPAIKSFFEQIDEVFPDDNDMDTGEAEGKMSKVQQALDFVQQVTDLVNGKTESIGGEGGMEGATGFGQNVIEQLNELFTAISSADITDNVTTLQTLLDKIKELSGLGQGYTSFGAPMGNGIVSQLSDMFTVLGSGNVTSAAASIQLMADSLKQLGSVDSEGGGAVTQIGQLLDKLSGFDWATLTTQIQGFADQISQMGSAISGATVSVTQAIDGMVQACISRLAEANHQFFSAGQLSATNFANGMNGSSAPASAAANMAHKAVFAAQSNVSGFYAAGVMAASGMAAGIRSKAADVASEAANMVKDAIAAAKREAEVQSPSRVFREIGFFSGEGYRLGISDTRSSVSAEAANMVKGAIDYAYAATQDDMTLHPVIEPVINLDSVRQDANEVDALLNTMGSSALAHSVGAASAVARQLRKNQEIQNESTDDTQTATVNNTFTQNITSPKAVSRAEIYRDTRNLFALEKGAAVREKGVYTR